MGERKRRTFPITYLFPNMITMAGLCAGLSAIRYGMLGRWEMAVVFLVAAAVIDGVDGRLARLLNATSSFGAQLDSLADFVSFGIAPVFVLYLWMLHDIKGFGWAVVLFYAVCSAVRLARFNSRIFEDKDDPEKQALADKFFTGVPAPAGAMLCLLPLVVHFQFGEGVFNYPPLVALYVVFVAILMASTIPTLSAKKFKVTHSYAAPLMLLSGLWIAGWIIEPWYTFTGTALFYFLLIPYSMYKHQRITSGAQDDDE